MPENHTPYTSLSPPLPPTLLNNPFLRPSLIPLLYQNDGQEKSTVLVQSREEAKEDEGRGEGGLHLCPAHAKGPMEGGREGGGEEEEGEGAV